MFSGRQTDQGSAMRNLLSRPLAYLDVGARGGLQRPWADFRSIVSVIGFEPDQEEYERLVHGLHRNDRLLPVALHRHVGTQDLYLTRSRGSSSMLRPNHEFLQRYPDSARFAVEKTVTVQVTTLDSLHSEGTLPLVDVIKLDTQGTELDILEGGRRLVQDHVVAIELEVEFAPMYVGQLLFADVDLVVRGQLGFQLQDLRKTYWKLTDGQSTGAPKGQLIFGDALYLRSFDGLESLCETLEVGSARQKVEMAIATGIVYGYVDYSSALLVKPWVSQLLGGSPWDAGRHFSRIAGEPFAHSEEDSDPSRIFSNSDIDCFRIPPAAGPHVANI